MEKWNLELQAAVEKRKEEKETQDLRDQDELLTGFDAEQRTWELIVKYQGNLKETLQAYQGIAFEELIAGYGILTVPENQLEVISRLSQIEYLEKPVLLKENIEGNLGYAQRRCLIAGNTGFPNDLSGKGVIVAVIDSGISAGLTEFQNNEGETRILRFWDQESGRVYEKEEINEWLENPESQAGIPVDRTGHGTSVASILAGNTYGIAREADLVVVRLGSRQDIGFGRTTDIMRGVTFCIQTAIQENKPIAINLSYGTVQGAHRGNSLLERFLDNASEIWKTVICVGAGNEGDSDIHASATLASFERKEIEFSIGGKEEIVMQIYLGYTDRIFCKLVTPRNEEVELRQFGTTVFSNQEESIFSVARDGTPYSGQREIYLEIRFPRAVETMAQQLWKIVFQSEEIVDGRIDLYMKKENRLTGFLEPDPNGTITIPATAEKVISVGATDFVGVVYAPFSGRGFANTSFGKYVNKPDLVAAGVSIPAIDREGKEILVTGTSFSTPVVTGMAALYLEWGIINENDPFLYGQKCKARLIQGAQKVRGVGNMSYPNPLVGWGSACSFIAE